MQLLNMNPIRKRLELYHEYRDYVRVDLVVYGVMALLMILSAVLVQFTK